MKYIIGIAIGIIIGISAFPSYRAYHILSWEIPACGWKAIHIGYMTFYGNHVVYLECTDYQGYLRRDSFIRF